MNGGGAVGVEACVCALAPAKGTECPRTGKKVGLLDHRPQGGGEGQGVLRGEAEGPLGARPHRDLKAVVRSLAFEGTGEPWMVLISKGQC